MKIITTTFTVILMLSLASLAGAQKRGTEKPIVECANSTVGVNKYSPAPGEEMMSTATINNCSKEQASVTVEQILTDACGERTTLSTTTFSLRKGETRQAMVSYLAPNASECGSNFMVTAIVTSQRGTQLAAPSTYFTVTTPTP